MKKTITIVLVLALCLSMSACLRVPDDPNSSASEPTGDPVIELDLDDIRREERFDAAGNLIGYYQFTGGTNCGFNGVMLLECLDANGNVLKSFSPQHAGAWLILGRLGGYTYISEQTVAGTKLEYGLTADCEVRSCIYYKDNRSTAVELYGQNGEVTVRRDVSSNDKALFLDTGYGNCTFIQEGYIKDNTVKIEREWVYDSADRLLCEVGRTDASILSSLSARMSRIEVKDAAGKMLKVYEASEEGTFLELIYGYPDAVSVLPLSIYEYTDSENACILQEIYDPVKGIVLFKEKLTYNGEGIKTHSEVVICGGKAITTLNETNGNYTKIDFYDPEGVLQKTVEAPAPGGFLKIEWDFFSNWCWIDVYDASGNKVGYDVYEPRQ